MAASNISIGARIRALRERSELMSQDLARAVGLDPSAMSNIESGKRAVKTDELSKIAQALGVSPLAILDEGSLLAHLPAAMRVESMDRDGPSALQRLTSLTELHEVLAHGGLPASPALDDVPTVDIRDWKSSAERLAAWAQERLELSPDSDDRFVALADSIEKNLQIDVAVEDHTDMSLAGAAITDRSFPLVYVRASQPKPRALFTLAHELGHVLADDGQTFTFDQDLTAHTDQERLANAFAATLLMPASDVSEACAESGLDALSLARMLLDFGVSFESLVYRLHNLGFVNYQGRNELRGRGLRAVIADVTDEAVVRSLLSRLADGQGVPTRAPAWLAVRALLGYRRGVISARPLADLLGFDADEFVLHSGKEYTSDWQPPQPAGSVGSDEERYSGSPV